MPTHARPFHFDRGRNIAAVKSDCHVVSEGLYFHVHSKIFAVITTFAWIAARVREYAGRANRIVYHLVHMPMHPHPRPVSEH